MKVFDCFTFYNELDLLDLRLELLYDSVDFFVLVEADRTFSGIPKRYIFEDNLARYQKYLDKIILIHCILPEQAPDAWARERAQRNMIVSGLDNAKKDDYIIISDLDEIPRPETIQRMKDLNKGTYYFRVPMFNFKLNFAIVSDLERYRVWNCAVRKDLLDVPERHRMDPFAANHIPFGGEDSGYTILEHAGWHFSYIGDDEYVKNKFKSFSHQELNIPEIVDNISIERFLQEGIGSNDRKPCTPVAVDDYFPKQLQEEKYQKYIIPNITRSIVEFLPFC